MNKPSSLKSFTQKALAISTTILAATACDHSQPECPLPTDCSEQVTANAQLDKDLKVARAELAKALGVNKIQASDLAQCQADLGKEKQRISDANKEAEKKTDHATEPVDRKIQDDVATAIQKAGVQPQNREMITFVLTKLLTTQQEPAADDDALRLTFGDDAKMQMMPLKRQTTIASVSADFLKTMGELPVAEKVTVLKWLGNCMPEALKAANEFKKYESLFRDRIFDACPDAFSIDNPDHLACIKGSLVEEYHDLPRVEKMVMRLIWQITIRPETVKRIGGTVTAATRENGFGL